jgi:hypothetical protein
MIRIQRSRLPAPSVLVDRKERGDTERRKAESYYKDQNGNAHKKAFPFKIYKDEAVKAVLEKLFHNKCAYCESYYSDTQPLDVEHWRPKGAVDPEPYEGSEALPGYYWLAADWDNLLPSCIDCNRSRNQREEPEGKVRLLGKANRFPIEQGSKRARSPQELQDERPLLLNPCEEER